MALQVACDGEALAALADLAALRARDGGAPLARDGGDPPRAAPRCYRSTHYTRSISSSPSCS